MVVLFLVVFGVGFVIVGEVVGVLIILFDIGVFVVLDRLLFKVMIVGVLFLSLCIMCCVVFGLIFLVDLIVVILFKVIVCFIFLGFKVLRIVNDVFVLIFCMEISNWCYFFFNNEVNLKSCNMFLCIKSFV